MLLHLQSNKDVFDIKSLPVEAFSHCMGLLSVPKIKVLGIAGKRESVGEEGSSVVADSGIEGGIALASKGAMGRKINNSRHDLTNIISGQVAVAFGMDVAENSLGSVGKKPVSGDVEGTYVEGESHSKKLHPKLRKTKELKIVNRQNVTVLSDAFAKLREEVHLEAEMTGGFDETTEFFSPKNTAVMAHEKMKPLTAKERRAYRRKMEQKGKGEENDQVNHCKF